jgi:ribokinase
LDVIGIGALNFDRLYRIPRAAKPGEELRVLSCFTGGGGSAANTIVGLARLGVKTGFIGVVGEDSEGELLLKELRREGVDTEGITRRKGRTGEIIGLVDNKGERILYAYPGVNDSLEIDASKLEYAKKARFLHLSSFVGEPSYRAQKNILKLKNKISFSPGMLYAKKGIAELRAVVERSEVVFMNREELRLLTGEEPVQGAERLLEAGAKVVVVTLGGKGCYIASDELKEEVPGYPSDAVDTTGAGDAFAAGFLFGMLEGFELTRCGKLGNKLASLCIAAMGARTGLPRREEIEDFISALR